MNILFVSPHYGRQRWIFPHAFAILLAYLKKHIPDLSADYVDVCRDGLSRVRERYLSKHHGIIAITGLTSHYANVKSLVEFLRTFVSEKTKIIVGGAIITSYPDFMIRRLGADYYVSGEGEEAFLEIVHAFENNQSIKKIKNVGYLDGGQVFLNENRPFISNLDDLPWQDYETFNFKAFMHQNAYSAQIFASRGCPYRCGFCYRLYGVLYRARSIQNIVDEMEFLVKTYKVYNVIFCDEIFFTTKANIESFCAELLRRKFKVTWYCSLRVNLVDPALLGLMHRAGCMSIGYGIESGSQRMLDKIGKKVTVKQNRNALAMTLDANILPAVNLVMGYAGETTESIAETAQFLKETRCHGGLHFAQALPGTPLYQEVRVLGFIPDEEKYFTSLKDEIEGLPIDFNGLGKDFVEQEQRKITESTREYYKNYYRRYKWERIKYFVTRKNWNYFLWLIYRIWKRVGKIMQKHLKAEGHRTLNTQIC